MLRCRKIVDERLDDVMDAFNENGEEHAFDHWLSRATKANHLATRGDEGGAPQGRARNAPPPRPSAWMAGSFYFDDVIAVTEYQGRWP